MYSTYFLQQPKALSRRAPHVFCVFCCCYFVGEKTLSDSVHMWTPKTLCVCSPSLFVWVGILLLKGRHDCSLQFKKWNGNNMAVSRTSCCTISPNITNTTPNLLYNILYNKLNFEAIKINQLAQLRRLWFDNESNDILDVNDLNLNSDPNLQWPIKAKTGVCTFPNQNHDQNR